MDSGSPPRSPTIKVPGTPILEERLYMRSRARRNAICEPADREVPQNLHVPNERTAHGVIRRLTELLEDSTARASRLRIRLQISNANEEAARADLLGVEVQRDLAIDEVKANEQETWVWKVLVAALVGSLLLYMWWCHVNGPDFAYIKARRMAKLG